MGYFIQTDAAPRKRMAGRSRVHPKTHTPGPQVQQRGQRFYSPGLGRWLSRDPIEERGGRNLYSYVNNSPVCHIDPLGLKKRDCEVIVWYGHASDIRDRLRSVAGEYKDDGCTKHALFGCKAQSILDDALLSSGRIVANHPRITFDVGGKLGGQGPRWYQIGFPEDEGDFRKYYREGQDWFHFTANVFSGVLNAARQEAESMAGNGCLMRCECDCDKVTLRVKFVSAWWDNPFPDPHSVHIAAANNDGKEFHVPSGARCDKHK